MRDAGVQSSKDTTDTGQIGMHGSDPSYSATGEGGRRESFIYHIDRGRAQSNGLWSVPGGKLSGHLLTTNCVGAAPSRLYATVYERRESRMLWLLALTGGFDVGRTPVFGLAFCLVLATA